MIWWHGSTKPLTTLDFQQKAGLHLGTRETAAQFGPHLHGFTLCSTTRIQRAKDTGEGWMPRAKAARKRGIDALIYLNRFEGFDSSLFLTLDKKILDSLETISDAAFKKHFPHAVDSILVLNPIVLYPLRQAA